MLKNTFIHVPGLGTKTEQRIWSSGVHSWNDLLNLQERTVPFSHPLSLLLSTNRLWDSPGRDDRQKYPKDIKPAEP